MLAQQIGNKRLIRDPKYCHFLRFLHDVIVVCATKEKTIQPKQLSPYLQCLTTRNIFLWLKCRKPGGTRGALSVFTALSDSAHKLASDRERRVLCGRSAEVFYKHAHGDRRTLYTVLCLRNERNHKDTQTLLLKVSEDIALKRNTSKFNQKSDVFESTRRICDLQRPLLVINYPRFGTVKTHFFNRSAATLCT